MIRESFQCNYCGEDVENGDFELHSKRIICLDCIQEIDEDELIFPVEQEYDWLALEEMTIDDFDQQYHDKADRQYPDMEDRHCSLCGRRLVRGSVAYYEGYHFDSCE